MFLTAAFGKFSDIFKEGVAWSHMYRKGTTQMIQTLRRHPIFQHTMFVLGSVVLVMAMLGINVSLNARQALHHGETAYQSGKSNEAIMHYERAIKWYTPLSPWVRQAVERLWDLGSAAEQRDDLSVALQAYQALRSSLYAVQSFYLPYRHWIPKSEAKIAVLMARTAQTEGQDSTKLAQDTARFARMLQRDTAPNLGGSILTEIGFFGWVGATVGLLWCAVGRHGAWAWRQGLLWGSGISVGFAAWVVGMLLA
jgi:hypothetical protein